MDYELGFLGGGRMASAIADGLLEARPDIEMAVSDPVLKGGSWGERKAKVVSTETLFASCRWLVWSIKPQIFNAEHQNWSSQKFGGEGMISVMAGVKSTSIETLFEGVPVVRTMPNTPMMFSQGMVALAAGAHAGEDHLDAVESFFSPVAKTLRVDEKQMDGVTAVSGSGPAYVFRLAEEVLEQSSELGLGREQALTLWAQTLRGAASMLEGETSPKELREQVTSPGGTTQAALETFETLGLASAFGAGLKAAYDRSIELS